MSDMRLKLYILVINICRTYYTVFAICSIIFIITYISMLQVTGFSDSIISKLVDSILLLFVSCTTVYSFSYGLKCFKFLNGNRIDLSFEQAARKLVIGLYLIAFFDGASLIFRVYNTIEYAGVSAGFYHSNSFLAPVVQFIESERGIISEMIGFFSPRPYGVVALLLGLFISFFVKRSSSMRSNLAV